MHAIITILVYSLVAQARAVPSWQKQQPSFESPAPHGLSFTSHSARNNGNPFQLQRHVQTRQKLSQQRGNLNSQYFSATTLRALPEIQDVLTPTTVAAVGGTLALAAGAKAWSNVMENYAKTPKVLTTFYTINDFKSEGLICGETMVPDTPEGDIAKLVSSIGYGKGTPGICSTLGYTEPYDTNMVTFPMVGEVKATYFKLPPQGKAFGNDPLYVEAQKASKEAKEAEEAKEAQNASDPPAELLAQTSRSISNFAVALIVCLTGSALPVVMRWRRRNRAYVADVALLAA